MALTNDVMDAVNIVVGAKAVTRKLEFPMHSSRNGWRRERGKTPLASTS